MPKSGKDALLGVVIGAVGVFSISFGVIGVVVGLVVVLAAAALRRSLWVVGAAFVTTGTIWIVLAMWLRIRCDALNNCENVNLVPFLTAILVLIAVGTAAGGLAWWLDHRRPSRNP